MVKLTRLNKFNKIVRAPKNDISNKTITKSSAVDEQPPDWIDIDSDVRKPNKSGVRVKKVKKKHIISKSQELPESQLAPALSRGKRKREAKKLAWRKKYEFEKTCLDILKENQAIDKHGEALGSVSDLKSSLDVVEKKLTKVRKIGKRKNKTDYKARLKKKMSKDWNEPAKVS